MNKHIPTTHAPGVLTYRRQTFTVQPGMTVRDAVLKCNLNPETVLAVRAGRLITGDAIVQPGDQIKLIATISGG
jgi:sulfur carrier protein ThiS